MVCIYLFFPVRVETYLLGNHRNHVESVIGVESLLIRNCGSVVSSMVMFYGFICCVLSLFLALSQGCEYNSVGHSLKYPQLISDDMYFG